MSIKSLTRRDFLKLGCLTTTATGLAVCGAGAAISSPDQSPIELPSFDFGPRNEVNRILVAYASATGSTVEVAAAIGESLGAYPAAIDVRPVRDNPRIEEYQAIVIGSPVHFGKWLSEAIDFIKANQDALKRIPVALFCVHITNLGDDAASRQNRLAFLNNVRPLANAVYEGYFAGRFNRRGAFLLLPGLLARFVPTLDFRNWDKIRIWADNLYPRLIQPAG